MLSDTTVRSVKSKQCPQKLSDGGGLYLYVAPTGGKLWRMAYRFHGKQKTLSFGPYPALSLKDARKMRDDAKELLVKGIDPNEHRREVLVESTLAEKEQAETFEYIAREWFSRYAPGLSPKHAEKLMRFLEKRLFPVIGTMPVREIEPAHLLDAVRPAEAEGHIETAHKLMQLCGQVMRYARITGRVKYDVASGLSEAMMKPKVTHFAAVTKPKDIGRLLQAIDAYRGHFAVHYFLKILPYVFTRPSELRLAQWVEFDFENDLWTIPAERMKMRRPHVVPLSRQVVDRLQELYALSGNTPYLFPSIQAKSSVISDAGPLVALRRLGYEKKDMTLHGFRAMASTNLNEIGHRADVIEAQLAHKEPDSVRLAYNRAQYMDERKKMMQAWADWLDEVREKA